MIPDRLKSTLGLAALLLASTAAQAADPVFNTLLSFDATAHGSPVARPIWAGGAIYGTTRIGTTTTGTLYRVNPATGALTVIHDFPTTAANGIANQYPLVMGLDGALYGTRAASVITATATGDESKVGELYRLPLTGAGAGSLTFTPLKAADGTGFAPISALFQASSGKFYGVTYSEFFEVNADGSGAAVFFKEDKFYASGIAGISSGGKLMVPHSVPTAISTIATDTKLRTQIVSGTSMTTPTGIFARGADGTFYGTDKSSRVIKLTDQADSLQTLYTFTSPDGGLTYPQGNQPLNYLALGYDGKLYGVTNAGGNSSKGVIYSVDPAAAEGSRYTKLHDFSGTDGAYPTGIAQGRDGKLYGTTSREGANGVGTLFSLDVGIVAPAPSVTSFTATPASVTVGSPAKLAWASDNTSACRVTAAGYDSGAQGASGEISVTPATAATVEYTVSCTGSGDFAADTATQKVSLTATPPVPVVTAFTATPGSVTVGDPAKLAWTSTNTNACRITATGYDSGAQGSSGEVTVTPSTAGTVDYTLTCSSAFAVAPAVRTVALTATPRSGGGGGAMGPGLLLMASALALWRRRNRQA